MTDPLTERSARIVAARKLTRRAGRDAAGLFLAEGRQAVAEALADPSGVREVFVTEAAAAAHRDLLAATSVPVRMLTEKAAAGLSETVTPQGLVAVCALRDVAAETLTAEPPQLAVAKRAVDAETVIINIGANDLHWSSLVFLCAAADSCDNRALTAYFQHSLDRFTQDYYELLRQLTALPSDPLVLINQYYEPFDPALDCLAPDGLTSEKIDVLLARLDTVNQVLANGAETFGYRSIQPDFTGHELCTDQSYVQSEDDPAPLHPNARGHLAIALADERALLAPSS